MQSCISGDDFHELVMNHVGANTGIWCCFEKAMSVAPEGKKLLLDVAAMSDGEAQLLTDGLTAQEEKIENDGTSAGTGWQAKAQRETHFPVELIERAYEIDIFRAQSSRPVDWLRILASVGVAVDIAGSGVGRR